MPITLFNIPIRYKSIVKTKCKILVLVFLILCTLNSFSKLKAQTIFCPPNINFENGNLSNWLFYVGTCCPIYANSKTSAIIGRHTLTSGNGVDPYGNFPIVAPNSGSYSLKLGNSSTGNQAEKARYFIKVPNNNNNYKLIFRYAVVLENPDHDPSEQPRFDVRAYDSVTNQPVTCVQFSFVASSNLPGFNLYTRFGDSVYYKSWSTASLDLKGYSGRTIAVDFASGDCHLGGHFGYGYVDVNCGLFEIETISCKGMDSSTLTGPSGFLSYTWYDSTFTTQIGSQQTIKVNNPLTYQKYNLVITPYAGFGCPDTLSTIVQISDLNAIINKDTTICKNASVQFQNSASASGLFLPLQYAWSPSYGLNCSNCLNPIVKTDSSITYSLTVTDARGCSEKLNTRINVKLYIDSQPKDTIVCLNSNFKLQVSAKGSSSFSYQWLKNGVPIAGQDSNVLQFTNVQYSDTASYAVIITNDCDTLISEYAKISIFPPSNITLQPLNQITCLGTKIVLRAKFNTKNTVQYQWVKNGVNINLANKDSLVLNSVKHLDTGYYQLYIYEKCNLFKTDSVKLSLYPGTNIISNTTGVATCLNSRMVYKVVASGYGILTYQWFKNGLPLAGQTADSLVINPVQYTDTVSYWVKVKSFCDSITTTGTKLRIWPSTQITTQPQNLTVCLNSKGVLTVKAAGMGNFSYQWLKNGLPILGATNDTLAINSIKYSDTANYNVVVKSLCDSVLSNTVKIGVHQVLAPNFPDTTYLCNENAKIGTGVYQSYLWNTGATTDSIYILTEGKYWVKVTDNYNCINFDTTHVYLNSKPLVWAGKDTILCNQLPLKLQASAINFDSITWVKNNFGTFSNLESFNTTYTADSLVIGKKTISFMAKNRCGTTTDDLTVEFTPIPDANFELSDTLVCTNGNLIYLKPADTAGVFWGINVFDKIFTPRDSGFFTIQYQVTKHFCSNSLQKIIEVVAQPIANFNYKPVNPNIDKSVQFFSNSKFSNNYVWAYENTVFSNIQNPIYHFLEEGFYPIQLKAINRICSDTNTQLLYVFGSNNIFIPNAFTPNQNGLNEEFKVLYKNSKGAVLHIFNRWGQLIFTSNDVNKGWDGTFDGNPCQEDVYYYIVDYKTNSNEIRQLKGNFTLIR